MARMITECYSLCKRVFVYAGRMALSWCQGGTVDRVLAAHLVAPA
jgi:hypothetical protein